jgi:hypothetical protein
MRGRGSKAPSVGLGKGPIQTSPSSYNVVPLVHKVVKVLATLCTFPGACTGRWVSVFTIFCGP